MVDQRKNIHIQNALAYIIAFNGLVPNQFMIKEYNNYLKSMYLGHALNIIHQTP